MAKWKCEICGNEFDNFHAQGFDNKIYCPLCYFKKENRELKNIINQIGFEPDEIAFLQQENAELKKQVEETDRKLFLTKHELDMREKTIDNKLNQQKEFIKYLEDEIKLQEEINDIVLATGFEEILQKYKETIGGIEN